MSSTYSVEHFAGTERHAGRSYSPAIVTRGGRTIYLAGQTGSSLKDLVTMTVFINDPRHGDRFVEIRKEFFGVGHYPCSALITVSDFARSGMLIEIQGIAVAAD
jgi:2-iminobutanoate/2-iminopropanoate deaminase